MRVFRIHRFRFTHPLRLCVHVLVCVLRGFGIRLLSLYSRFVRNRLATLYCFFSLLLFRCPISTSLVYYHACSLFRASSEIAAEETGTTTTKWYYNLFKREKCIRWHMHSALHCTQLIEMDMAVFLHFIGEVVCKRPHAHCTTERHSPFSISLKYDSKIWTKFWWFRE